jgi:TolB-like protein/Flp pilus assembly protein TadD
LTNEPRLGGDPTPQGGHRAVFLSYASEDAQAAQGICAALRAAGIEVWFDQSELRGGDAWDAAIRKQIRSCALFIPVISANTHARIEGYFRLEWKLAVDRSHLLAPDQAFLLPVAIDQTPQSDERLPDRFRELQWTRLPDGHTPPAFVERIARLLSPDTSQAQAPRRPGPEAPGAARVGAGAGGPATARGPGSLGQSRKALALVAVAILVGVGCFALYALVVSRHASDVSGTSAAAVAAAPATHGAIAERSIAVLPFVDMSEKKDQEYFSDGLSDELINLLGKIPGLRVPARTSSFYFKGRQSTLPEIGRVLNVSHVLEGSVRKSGSALRISAELISVTNDTRVWSETYDRTLDDVFKVQDDIAGAVVAALKVSMLGDTKTRAAPTNNSEAYLHYLRGQESAASGNSANLDTAVTELQKAVALDPSFAEAWVGLGATYTTGFALWGRGGYDSARRDAMSALQRALALNPQLAGAHAELARVYFTIDWNTAAAQAELKRALAIDPKNGTALWLSGYIANSEGRFDEAIAIHSRLRENDPLRVDSYRQLGNTYYRAGRLDEGAALLADTAKRFPTATTIHYRLGLARLVQDQPQAALAEFTLEQDPDFRLVGPPLALDRLGLKQEADKVLAQALTIETVVNAAAYQVALIYAARGDADRAFQWLERAYRQRDPGMLWMKYDPLLRPLSRDPRFKSLLAEMHQS